MNTQLLNLLNNIEITKLNVSKIINENNIIISDNELINILYPYLKLENSKYYVKEKKSTHCNINYKNYLIKEFNIMQKKELQLFKCYYKSRNEFISDKTDNFKSLETGYSKSCEIIIFDSFNNEYIIDFENNKSIKEYDNLIYNYLINYSPYENIYIYPGLFIKYWRYQTNLTPINIKYRIEKKNKIIKDDILSEDWNIKYKQFIKLSNIKSPPQKSKQWFEDRQYSITASACASILGKDKYKEYYEFIIDKLKPNFTPNCHCYHGNKYEEIARLIYEDKYDVSVQEFGLLKHEKYNIIAASPDGICTPYKKDKVSKSNMVGTMLEIKCPTTRKINISNDVLEVVPEHYYEQIQQQLECCNLSDCDFFQCSISEYDSYDNFIKDSDPKNNYISLVSKMYKGCLIELLPKESLNKKGEDLKLDIYSKTLFIHPPKLNMSNDEYKYWICRSLTKKYTNNYVFHRILYWRVDLTHCIKVKRDHNWINNVLPKFTETMNIINKLRKRKEFNYSKIINYRNNLSCDPTFSNINNVYKGKHERKIFNNKMIKYIKSLI